MFFSFSGVCDVVVFLVALAMAVSIGSQVVGSMLVFVLLTMPSSTARYLGKSIPSMLAWSVGLALFGVWSGLMSVFMCGVSKGL